MFDYVLIDLFLLFFYWVLLFLVVDVSLIVIILWCFVIVWCCFSLLCIVVLLLLVVGHWCSLLPWAVVTPWSLIVRHRYSLLPCITTTPQLFIARHCYCLLPSLVVVPPFFIVVLLMFFQVSFWLLSFLGSLLMYDTIVPFHLCNLILSIWYYLNTCLLLCKWKKGNKKTQTSSSNFLRQVFKKKSFVNFYFSLCLYVFCEHVLFGFFEKIVWTSEKTSHETIFNFWMLLMDPQKN